MSHQLARVHASRLSHIERDFVFRRCTAGQFRLWDELAEIACAAPNEEFLANGLLVADSRLLQSARSSRRNEQIATLIRKNAVVPLDVARSRRQRYLVGCLFKGHAYFATWIEHVLSGTTSSLPTALATFLAPKCGMRPAAADTPQSLMDKGFVPSTPSRTSLYRRLPRLNSGSQNQKHERSPKPTASSSQLKAQATALVAKVAAVAGTPAYATGKERGLLLNLIRKHGYEKTTEYVDDAWLNKDNLLNAAYPMFTIQTVWFYAEKQRVSHRCKRAAAPSPHFIFTQVIEESRNADGKLNTEAVANGIIMHDLRRTAVLEAICSEFDIDPDHVFGS